MDTFKLLTVLDTPLIWVSEGYIEWANPAASALLADPPVGRPWQEVANDLPDGYTYRLHPLVTDVHSGMLIECIPEGNDELRRAIERLSAENQELERILESCLDEVFVTDADGITLRVNEAAAELYGMKREELIGMSVYELERTGVFYPSVTSMVLREKKRLSVLQTTRSGRRLMASANPVFDEHGNIVQVVTNAKDVTDLDLTPLMPETSDGQRNDASPKSVWVARSPQMKHVLQTAARAAATDVTVLILGETGVGKNRVAQYIHEHSRRRSQSFIHVNCASIPESLFESELFGYDAGAFTGAGRRGKPGLVEMADGGTLFLDEIGELAPTMQSKLLEFVQDQSFKRVGGVRRRHVNTRIIAATNRDLAKMVTQGEFRADLYYRLNVLPIVVAPLRERPEDAGPLFCQAVERISQTNGLPRKTVTADALHFVANQAWPGNVRQLENVAQRTVLLFDSSTVTAELIRQAMEDPLHGPGAPCEGAAHTSWSNGNTQPPASTALEQASDLPTQTLKEMLEAYEQRILRHASSTYPSTYAIAKALGISQSSVVRKLRRYGIGER
ncbi:MAG: sigma 54-interacting transcriptional regulator [Alicyclobacillus herbarius]|uniref:sigma-54 interaction domain-containing protein n=1 Tax=Alicyclobacillus herbarius TaxID=122960 RepID=UPI0023562B4C|nr:sigma 54-interacting transcriptional regulator [Alicyclobacillus herbarius]MCL6633410.1 sigma 54-interacting transcriptional regulator [Alicyclobacillus herbarius]